MQTSKPRRNIKQAEITPSDDDLLEHLVSYDVWDALAPYPYNSARLFGNANVGNLSLTNMQVAGACEHGAFFITDWYARTNITANLRGAPSAVWQYVQRTYLTLMIGDHVTWCAPLSTLFERQSRYRSKWPAVAEERASIYVRVDSFGVDGTLANLEPQPLFWIHLQGVVMPRAVWEPGPGVDDAAENNRRFARLKKRVFGILTGRSLEATDTAEHIANWLGQTGLETGDPEIRSQLMALADGIREGQWRPEKQPKPDEPR